MIAELYGFKEGCSKGVGGSMHLIDLKKNFYGSTAIVSNSIPVGVGLAYSMKLNKEKNLVCIYIGDASIEEGVFFEAIKSQQRFHPLTCLGVGEEILEFPRSDPGGQEDGIRLV